MILIKTHEEIDRMRTAGRALRKILDTLSAAVEPGITTVALDQYARKLIDEHGLTPSLFNYQPDFADGRSFPAACCISVNEEVAHGLPDTQPLDEGDVVSLDLTVGYEGYHVDAAVTVPVGKIGPETEKLIKITEETLRVATAIVKEGAYLGDIGAVIDRRVRAAGFSVVKDLVGHGIGKFIHEDPSVPNYGEAGTGVRLAAGMTLAIEPMVAMGLGEIKLSGDGWAYVTRDHSMAAHFEDTVAVTARGAEILTR